MRSRSDDAVADALERAVLRISDAVVSVAAANPVVLIDGRSGAGKTTLTGLLVERWPLAGRVQQVALDLIYPGWDGLDAGAETARRDILVPLAGGRIATWRRWDWTRGEEAESHAVDPGLGLILEGCGAITPQSARLADVLVWVESPDTVRRDRALRRDGDGFRPHWEMWAAQERAHIERDRPQALATLRVTVP